VTVVLSFFTERKPDSELVGLVKGLTPAESTAGVPYFRRPVFYASIALIIFVALNIYFW
jgi:SSS family solute:Na+ symporter